MRFASPTLAVVAGLSLGVAACTDSTGPGTKPPPPPPQTCTAGTCAAKLTGNIASSRTLSSDTVYTLSGFVKVQSGATLTIAPGTKLVGDTTVAGSSLWILRGARIDAQGTVDRPIVFTSARSPGNRAPGDWGGLIIVGNGLINRTVNPIQTEGPGGTSENYAGGTDYNDNSGVLKYVRVEFAGYDVSNGQGQELNGVSAYAVGAGTQYDYVQTMAGLDDSFEWFGGAVQFRHLVSYESGDDHFDTTEGFSGRGQFLIGLQTRVINPRPGTGTLSSDPRGFEGDGCEADKAGCTYANAPYSMPTFVNFTVIGPGPGVFTPTDGSGAMIRRGAGGTFVNGIIARWPNYAVAIRDRESDALRQVDSLIFRNVTLAENGGNFEPVDSTASVPKFGANINTPSANFNIDGGTAASLFMNIDPAAGALDFTPAAGASIRTSGMTAFPAVIAGRTTNFFGGVMEATPYAGAADPSGTNKWWQGWTVYAAN